MGRACDAVSALESAEGSSSRGLEPLEHWLAGNPQKRWAEANLQIPSGLVAITMENKSKPKLQVMPMRSDERLAQRIAVEILPQMGPGKILDIGCGDGVVSGYLPQGCSYQGLDINDACIYEQRHDNPNVQYIEPKRIPELMQSEGPWETILLLDVIEHTRDFTKLFELALQQCQRNVLVSLPNELFILDRLRMLKGQELNAHSLDRLSDPEGFKHQFIINIDKARSILSNVAGDNKFELVTEVVRPLISKNKILQPALRGLRAITDSQLWSMGSVFVFHRQST